MQCIVATNTHTIRVDNNIRSYIVYTPVHYNHNIKYPVMIMLHGGGGDGNGMMYQTQMNTTADNNSFITVYPNGLGKTWNADTCCGYAVDHNINDVTFISKIINTLPRQYNVNLQKIYVSGFSNGGMLCYKIGVQLSDKIAAIAPVSCTMNELDNFKAKIPIIHIHGLQDKNAPFNGGYGENSMAHVYIRPVNETISFCRVQNECNIGPTTINNNNMIIDVWREQTGKFPVMLVRVKEAGHTWSGGKNITPIKITGNLVQSIDTSNIIWTFCNQFQRK